MTASNVIDEINKYTMENDQLPFSVIKLISKIKSFLFNGKTILLLIAVVIKTMKGMFIKWQHRIFCFLIKPYHSVSICMKHIVLQQELQHTDNKMCAIYNRIK